MMVKTKNKQLANTATDNYDVYEYDVYWFELVPFEEWKHKPFANKKEAQLFAKRHKSKIKPYPYITQTIVDRNTFRQDVDVEYCQKDFKTIISKYDYRKIIKY